MVLLKAPANGIVTFNTAGSTFDTVLHLTGTPPSNLTPSASTMIGGFFSSEVKFNAVRRRLSGAVVGFGGAGGGSRGLQSQRNDPAAPCLSWSLKARQSRWRGGDAGGAGAECGSLLPMVRQRPGDPRRYGGLLPHCQRAEQNALRYTCACAATGAQAVEIESLPATIQIGAETLYDKLRIRCSGRRVAIASQSFVKNAGGSVARGYSGSQVFNTFGGTKDGRTESR